MVAEGIKTSKVVVEVGRAVRRRDADRPGGLPGGPRGLPGHRGLPRACCGGTTGPSCTAWAEGRTDVASAPGCCAASWGGCASPTTSSATCPRSSAWARTSRSSCPSELMPVGARTVFRALRTRAAAQIGPDWVWPYWLERQLDPTSPAFVPRGHLPFLTNVTHRNWTAVGNLDSPWEAIVDPRGLVTPWFDGWSLDWWIGADDRWHLPSREVGVRQRLVGGAPVVETAMSIPGGDAVAAGLRGAAQLGRGRRRAGGRRGRERARRRRSPWPWPCGPYNARGPVGHRADRPAAAATVTVDGRVALLLPKPPGRVAASTFHDGDSAADVMAGDAGERWRGPGARPGRAGPGGVRLPAGARRHAAGGPPARARAPHPAPRRARAAGWRRARRSPTALPPGRRRGPGLAGRRATGACGWCCPTTGWPRRWTPTAASCCCSTTATRSRPGPATYHRFWFRDAAYLLGALDRYGYHDEVAQVLASYPGRQRNDGFFFSQRQEWDANGAALRRPRPALAPDPGRGAGRGDGRARSPRACTGSTASAAPGKRRAADPALRGCCPPGVSAEHLGPFDHFYWDDFWGVAGLRAGAELLRGRRPARGRRRRRALRRARCGPTSRRSLALTAERLGTAGHPGRPAPPASTPAPSARWWRARRSTCCRPTTSASPPPPT